MGVGSTLERRRRLTMGAVFITGPGPASPRWTRPLPAVLAALLALSLSPPVPVRAQAAKTPATLTVRSGDTLGGISQRTGVPVAELKRLNGLKDSDLLQVGQTLRLAPAPRKGAVVVVKSGDTLEIIAKAHNTTVAALQKANPGVQPEKLKVGGTLRLPFPGVQAALAKSAVASAPAKSAPAPAKAAAVPTKPTTAPQVPPAKPPSTPTPPTSPPASAIVPDAPPLRPPAPQTPPSPEPQDAASRGRWRYYGDTVVDWGSWKRLPDGVRFTLVQAAAKDVGEARAEATAIAVDCSTLRHTWRAKEAWEAWSVPAPRSVGQQIVLDLCGNTAADDRRPVPPPPSPTP